MKRSVVKSFLSRPTVEGAGVHLRRAFGFHETGLFDPFLMLDHFHSNNPKDYEAGFPWHPHRGIETVTYMIEGKVLHEDSTGNKGVIGDGGIQWMTAGSGIIHSEMPKQSHGTLHGFQLWVNLPAKSKMMNPRYQDIKPDDVPVVSLPDGATVRVAAGVFDGISGPVKDIVAEPMFLDIKIPQKGKFVHKISANHKVVLFVVDGGICVGDSAEIGSEHTLLLGDGESMEIYAGVHGARFLLMAGKPIGEPIAWYGPIVMNTDEELQVAFEEYQNGSFLKHR